jgi:hypothetical protein
VKLSKEEKRGVSKNSINSIKTALTVLNVQN